MSKKSLGRFMKLADSIAHCSTFINLKGLQQDQAQKTIQASQFMINDCLLLK